METLFTLEQALAIGKALNASPAPQENTLTPGSGRKVIVRSRDAGVQYGELEGYNEKFVVLKNARQMWSWTAAKGGSLLDCANYGVSAGKFFRMCLKRHRNWGLRHYRCPPGSHFVFG